MLDIALIHYPVSNTRHEVIGSAVTNLDIHDIARAGRTYGVDNFFIITPFADQQKLVGEIIGHWRHGYGARHNPDRKEAFSIVSVFSSMTDLWADYSAKGWVQPTIVATSAKVHEKSQGFSSVSERLAGGEHMLLLFGTASGLAPEIMDSVDVILPPVGGREQYNHLSVRSACSIVLDRLLGVR